MWSHRAPGFISLARALCPIQRASPTMPLRPTSLVRAGVRRSASLRARCDRAAMALAGCALGRSAPRSKGSTGARSRGAQRLAAKRHWWPSGRSGAGWRRSQGLPWVGGGLGGALRRQGRRSSLADFYAAFPPWAASPRSSAWAEFRKISRESCPLAIISSISSSWCSVVPRQFTVLYVNSKVL